MKAKRLFLFMTIPLILALASCDIGTTSGYIVPGGTLVEKLDWLRTNAKSGESYALEIGADESISSNRVLDFNGRNITITLKGTGGNRIISLSNNGNMFVVRAGVTLVLDNITLRGRLNNNSPLVYVRAGAALRMNDSAIITGNISTSNNGGGVQVEGTFIMNGGTITGNNAAINGGGVYVSSAGNFTMNGGTITGNNANNTGGGVMVVGKGTFIMSGGTISGNTARTNGGGVYAGGIFTKAGGTITSYDNDRRNGNVVSNNPGLVQSRNGHAVYAYSFGNNATKRKETTAGSGVSLSYDGRTGSFSGYWDF